MKPYVYIYDIWLNYSWNEMCFGQKLQGKSKHPFYVQLMFSENVEKYGTDRQVTDSTACWITKARMLIMKTTKSNFIITSESTGFSFIIIF